MQLNRSKIAGYLAALGAVLCVGAPLMAEEAAANDKPEATEKTERNSQAAAPIPADLKVAATVNGEQILMADINAVVERIQEQQPNIPASDIDNIKREICEELIVERLLVQEAKRQNLEPDKQKIDDAVWRYQKPFPSITAFQQHLKESGKTEADLRKILSDDLSVSALSRKLTEDITVGNDEISRFYNENKSEFLIPDMVHVRHIQLSVEKDAPAEEKAKTRKRAEEALKKATAPNADFAALAREYSDDKVSAQAGGDLGFIARDDIVDKAFGDAAFSAPEGKVYGKLVETNFGFNIIKIEEKKAERTLELSEISPHIKQRLMQDKLRQRLDERVEELRKGAKIQKNI